ncbi:ATP-binding protein, partial [Nocardia carnea]|uniref:ATP-binding protein n=1 Tax=Nocardia carnea TaxID=37328 RepID=UPI002456A937
MDPVRNPYAPGAGQRPPELAGRGKQLDAFDVVCERIARGRPERSVMLTGLRGVGKTVLLNQLRSAAGARGWGTGKIEARPDQELRRPLSSALHMAARAIAKTHSNSERVDDFLGILKAFALRATADKGMRERWQPGIDVPAGTRPGAARGKKIEMGGVGAEAAGQGAGIGGGLG